MTKKNIKLFDPWTDKSEEKAVIKVLKSHFWASGSGQGDVKKFEDRFRKFTGCKEAVAVNSGTAALNLALSSYDLKNKEVILPSFSFVSTAHTVILNGAKPVFADIESETLCIDPKQIEKLITKKTKAIVPVHFGGQSADIKEIKKICKKYNLYLIEDAAHATGTSFNGRKIGSHGDIVCFSFHPVKNLAMPTGGLLAINSREHKRISNELKVKRWCGITNRKESDYDIENIGWNYYMNEFSAAIGLQQIKKLAKSIKIKQNIAKQYVEKINLNEKMNFDTNCSYHLYWIRVKNREKFRDKMQNEGIETGTHYKPIHTFSMYKQKKRLSNTEKIAKEIVTIPIHVNLSNEEINRIIRSVNKYS